MPTDYYSREAKRRRHFIERAERRRIRREQDASRPRFNHRGEGAADLERNLVDRHPEIFLQVMPKPRGTTANEKPGDNPLPTGRLSRTQRARFYADVRRVGLAFEVARRMRAARKGTR